MITGKPLLNLPSKLYCTPRPGRNHATALTMRLADDRMCSAYGGILTKTLQVVQKQAKITMPEMWDRKNKTGSKCYG